MNTYIWTGSDDGVEGWMLAVRAHNVHAARENVLAEAAKSAKRDHRRYRKQDLEGGVLVPQEEYVYRRVEYIRTSAWFRQRPKMLRPDGVASMGVGL